MRVGGPDGPAPPLWDERRAYLVAGGGDVHALDAETGREVWQSGVRCGRDALLLAGGRFGCAAGRRPRLHVLDAGSGRLVARDQLEDGPYAVRAVGPALVFHDHRSGRLLGYDVARLAWTFDHRSEVDPPFKGNPALLSLGSRYLYTEEEGRTLYGVDVEDGERLVRARSDTPIRIDRGRAALATHGRIVSHDGAVIAAFDLAAGRRAWRIDLRALTGDHRMRIVRFSVEHDRVLVLAELPVAGSDDHPASRWLLLVGIHVVGGDVVGTVPLGDLLPWRAALRLLGRYPRRCDEAEVTDWAMVEGAPVIAIGAACAPRRSTFPHGWVVRVDPGWRRAAWVAPPETATRLVAGDGSLYGLWGGPGVPHEERSVAELDLGTGEEQTRRVVGYTPTWGHVRGDLLWIGTTAGTVAVFRR